VLFHLYRRYQPGDMERTPARRTNIKALPWSRLILKREITGALIFRDVQLLWRRQRSTFFLLLFAVVSTGIPSIFHTKAEEAFASSIALQIIFSWLLINSLLALFDYDVENLALIKSLPIKVGSLWWSRWRLAASAMIAPIIIPLCAITFKFPLDLGFLLFIFFGLQLVPAIFATLYCNAGFGMFPQIKYSGILLNLSLGMMLLFWFFMPFGTPLLLAVMLLWIRKSQKHFRVLEVA
jgi:hypothetical protein